MSAGERDAGIETLEPLQPWLLCRALSTAREALAFRLLSSELFK